MRKAFILLFHLEAEKMKRLLIALLLCFVFSSVAQAGKVGIAFSNDPVLDETQNAPAPGSDIGSCQYTSQIPFTVFVRGRKGLEIALQVVSNDEMASLYSRLIGRIPNVGATHFPNFEVDSGVSWSLVWTLSRVKGKGKILDAVEVASGTCE